MHNLEHPLKTVKEQQSVKRILSSVVVQTATGDHSCLQQSTSIVNLWRVWIASVENISFPYGTYKIVFETKLTQIVSNYPSLTSRQILADCCIKIWWDASRIFPILRHAIQIPANVWWPPFKLKMWKAKWLQITKGLCNSFLENFILVNSLNSNKVIFKKAEGTASMF